MSSIRKDYFGLEKEKKLNSSKVRKIFTPHTPIHSLDLFFGRETEVARLIEYLNTPGQHALLYGERGVGKSSLANITATLLLEQLLNGQLYRKRCDTEDTFASILAEPLSKVGVDVKSLEKEVNSKKGISGSTFIPTIGSEKSMKTQGDSISSLSPGWVATKIADLEGLLLIDEFDVIKNEADKKRIAELIKHLSDYNSKFKILIVGIADSAAELTAGHASVQRCLKELRISRMSPLELEDIILGGQKKLGLEFSNQAISRIVNVSSGYPHFTHLLALKAAEDAILDERSTVNIPHIIAATHRAVEDSEGTLKKIYDDSVRSANTDEYKKILLAASLCNVEEIRAKDLKEKYKLIFNKDISQGNLNNHFSRLVSDDSSCVLRRIAKGVYRFNDPRMSSYIRIAQSFMEESSSPEFEDSLPPVQ